MRNRVFFIFFISIINCIPVVTMAQVGLSARETLALTQNKLNSLGIIQYDYRRVIDYPSINKHNVIQGHVFLDFISTKNIMGLQFCYTTEKYKVIFNGKQSIYLDNTNKNVTIETNPLISNLKQLNFFNHSVYSLKNALSWIIADKMKNESVSDTIIDGKLFYNVKFLLKSASIHSDGRIWMLDKGINMNYSILIDRNSFLPIQISQKNYANNDMVRTYFSNIQENTEGFDQTQFSSLAYQKYNQTHTPIFGLPASKQTYSELNFRLPHIDNTRDSLSVSQFRNKLILIDFWMCNCGPCIEIIPKLHLLTKELDPQKFKVLSVNSIDSPEDIKKFMRKQPLMNYDVLFNGKEIAEKYDITGFPTLVLLNKLGKVIYWGDYDQEKIQRLIQENINAKSR